MLKIELNEEGMDQVLRQLENIYSIASAGPGPDRMTEMGRTGMADIDERFDSGGRGTWVPLSPITIANKGGRTEILIDTGNMRGSVGIGEVGTHRVTVTVPYGGKDYKSIVPVMHQLGNPDTNLPQRKIVEITSDLIERLRRHVDEWLRVWRG